MISEGIEVNSLNIKKQSLETISNMRNESYCNNSFWNVSCNSLEFDVGIFLIFSNFIFIFFLDTNGAAIDKVSNQTF